MEVEGRGVRHAANRPRGGNPLLHARPGWLPDRSRPGHGCAAGPSRQKAPGGPPGLSFQGLVSGVRQLIRNRPLEVTEVELPAGYVLRVPTPEETLRIKGYLIVRRNQVRDYLDVVALSDRYGIAHAADVLRHIDAYYSDQRGPESEGVATQLARQLADPKPADARTIGQLGRYKGLDARWTDWGNVTDVCRSLAVEMVQ